MACCCTELAHVHLWRRNRKNNVSHMRICFSLSKWSMVGIYLVSGIGEVHKLRLILDELLLMRSKLILGSRERSLDNLHALCTSNRYWFVILMFQPRPQALATMPPVTSIHDILSCAKLIHCHVWHVYESHESTKTTEEVCNSRSTSLSKSTRIFLTSSVSA